jgi:predicted Zn-dependent protease
MVTLVRFGAVEPDLTTSLVQSIEGFFSSLDIEEDLRPQIRALHRRLPAGIPDQNQGDFLLSRIEGFSGNIVLGITDIAFDDPNLPRRVFGYGRIGRGVLSTYRFRRESENRHLFFHRMNKEIIKILAMSCGLSHCHDTSCIVMYHRTMDEIDRNTSICRNCRQQIVGSLASYLR